MSDDSRKLEVEVESVRRLGRELTNAPMQLLDSLGKTIAAAELSSAAYGAFSVFGVIGGSLGDAHDEVKRAAEQYIQARRKELSDMHKKAFETANTYVEGDAQAIAASPEKPASPATRQEGAT
ncbi:hypothetical protein [Nonomuraea recticatena]|uniref:ESX-1 secretion-associated protein n=1 Tax=Nonomuraea recticatena TaxID=46178 RepID=A0ABP6FQ48_9ACTN